MASALLTAHEIVGPLGADLLVGPADATTIIRTILVGNVTDSTEPAAVTFWMQLNDTYVVRNADLDAGEAEVVLAGSEIFLAPGDRLRFGASADASAAVLVSYVVREL